MSFVDDLAAAKAAEPDTADVNVELNGKRYLLRFTRTSGTEYAAETLRHPPRLDVGLDKQYGYNLSSLTLALSPKCARLVDGDELVELSADQWADLFAAADGGAVEEMQNTIFHLNEFASAKAVAAAKKVLDGLTQN